MERKDIIQSPEYWAQMIKVKLFHCVVTYMKGHGCDSKELCNYFGEPESESESLLSGDFNGDIDTLCNIAIKSGFVPQIEFIPTKEYLKTEGLL